MKNINIFCFGFGQVAKTFIKKINAEKYNILLSTTSRKETTKQKFEQINYTSYKFDGESFDPEITEKITKSEYILVSIPPKGGTDLVFKTFSKIIENSKVKWITYLSATSVYGDHNGDWVTEESDTKAKSLNGLNRINAERLWMSSCLNKNLPLQIFRLSGIYSKKNNILERLKLGNLKIINKKNQFFSRIHVDDIAGSVLFLINLFFQGRTPSVVNIADNLPANNLDVLNFAAKIAKKSLPSTVPFEIAQKTMSPMALSFWQENRKVDNELLCKKLGYSLIYPDFRSGLKSCFSQLKIN